MKHKLRHYAYSPTLGGMSTPRINDLKDHAQFYKGTYSQYNPIAIGEVGMSDYLTAFVEKETCPVNIQKPFELPGFRISERISITSSDFSNNGSLGFTKQQLLRIAHAMDEEDVLHITKPDDFNIDMFEEGISKITNV